MSYTRSRLPRLGRARMLGLIILAAGLLFISMSLLQTSIGAKVSIYGSTFPEARVKIEDSGGLKEAVARAVRDWNEAVEDYNRIIGLRCLIMNPLHGGGCSSACPYAPPVSIVEGDDYTVLIVSVDKPPLDSLVADFKVAGQTVQVRVWRGLDPQKAYQVALYLIGRVQGVEVLDRRATLFGATPATSIREILEVQTPALNSRVKPTTLEVAGILTSRLGHVGVMTSYYTLFRAYDEPDFTIPALLSPALVAAGSYLLFWRRKHAG